MPATDRVRLPSILILVNPALHFVCTSLFARTLLFDLLLLSFELLYLDFELHSSFAEFLEICVLAVFELRPLLHLAIEPCDLGLRFNVLPFKLIVTCLEGLELQRRSFQALSCTFGRCRERSVF